VSKEGPGRFRSRAGGSQPDAFQRPRLALTSGLCQVLRGERSVSRPLTLTLTSPAPFPCVCVSALEAAASSSKTLASLRHISHFTAIGGRSGSKAAAYEAKRAGQAYKRAADRSTVAPDGRVQPLRTRTPAVGTDGKPLLFVGASKSILGRRQDADDKSKSESLSKPLSLSGLYPSVKLPKIEDEPLPRIVKPRVPGTPMKKKPRVLGHIERTRIDADEFAARLPYHRSTLYTIAVRAGLTDPALPQLAGRPRAYEGEEHATEVGQVEEADDLERAILQVLTHPSFFESSAALRSNVEPILSTEPLAPAKAPVVSSKEQERRDNSLLAATGRSIIDLVLTEYLVKRFPNLPTKSLGYALTALTNQGALVDVGRELAIGSLHTSRDHGQDDMQATGTVVRYRKLPYGVRPLLPFPSDLCKPCEPDLTSSPPFFNLLAAAGGAHGREARAQVSRDWRGRPRARRPRLRAPGPPRRDGARQAALCLALARL